MSCCHRGGPKESKVRHKKGSPFPSGIWAFVAFLATSVRGGFSPLRSPLGGRFGLETSREYGVSGSQKWRLRRLLAPDAARKILPNLGPPSVTVAHVPAGEIPLGRKPRFLLFFLRIRRGRRHGRRRGGARNSCPPRGERGVSCYMGSTVRACRKGYPGSSQAQEGGASQPIFGRQSKKTRGPDTAFSFWRRFPKKNLHFWTAVQKNTRPWSSLARRSFFSQSGGSRLFSPARRRSAYPPPRRFEKGP